MSNLASPRALRTAVEHIPFLDLQAQYAQIRAEVTAAVMRVLDSQQFILGPEVAALEKELSAYLGCSFVVGCASGSDALLLALMALGVGHGDEVITTPFTFVATAGSIARLGARPVFVDIDPATYNIDPQQIESAVTPRTRAIIPVHLFGLPADMEGIAATARRHRLPIIEDAAQAIGAEYRGCKVGTIGTMGCFSFFPSKNLGGAGDGGFVTTNDPALADALRTLRVHGSRKKYEYELLGMNSRLDAIQAAILRVKLRRLEAWTERRRLNAQRYQDLFAKCGVDRHLVPPATPLDCRHVYNQFTIRVRYRDILREHLRQSGVATEVYYPSPLHVHPPFAALGYKPYEFPAAMQASDSVVSLPIYPELTEDRIAHVVRSIAEFFALRSAQ